MAEIPAAAPAAGTTSTPAPAAPAAPAARPKTADLIAAATKALGGEETVTEVKAETKAEPAKPAMPSTPEAPNTAAVLEAQERESASAQIRERNAIADARKALAADRARLDAEYGPKFQALQQENAKLQRLVAEIERDPAAFAKLKESGRSAEEIARDIYFETVDITKVPAEQQPAILAHRERKAQERRLAELEAKYARSEQQRQQAEIDSRIAGYRGEIAAGLSGLGEGTPLVKELAAKRPDVAVSLLLDLAGRLAVEQKQLGKQSAAQLAEIAEKALEAELEPFAGYYERKYKPAAPAPEVKTPEVKAKTPEPDVAPRAISPAITDVTPVMRRPTTVEERLRAAERALAGN